jgi:hypothetical protein
MAEPSTSTREPPVSTTPVRILYVNWRGETSVRRIVPGPTWFGSTEWHPEPQWLMTADEPDTGKRRDFALAGIKAWGEEAVQNAGWRARGEPDPHGDRYDCPRERLCGGQLTDDQVAFQTAMLMRTDLNHEAVLAVAKDRIRWLSRRVAALEGAASFQARVQPWMMACFGEMIAGDREERNHRFLEEALELVQACGCTADEARQLVDYVFGRPVGEKGQEVGGVMVTLSALCLAQDLDLHREAEIELARIWTKVEQIRAKQAAKPKYSPLPEHVAPAALATEAARG